MHGSYCPVQVLHLNVRVLNNKWVIFGHQTAFENSESLMELEFGNVPLVYQSFSHRLAATYMGLRTTEHRCHREVTKNNNGTNFLCEAPWRILTLLRDAGGRPWSVKGGWIFNTGTIYCSAGSGCLWQLLKTEFPIQGRGDRQHVGGGHVPLSCTDHSATASP